MFDHIPKTKRMIVLRQIFNRIVRFDTFFERSDRCERTIDTPIIQVNQGKTRSANVNPFQTRQRRQSIYQKKSLIYLNDQKTNNHHL
jgi:hypothetical protein